MKPLLWFCTAILATVCFAKRDTPFWIQRSTFIEDGRLYAVGVSELNSDRSKARLQAMDRAVVEIQNYLQLTDIKVLTVDAQTLHEVQEGSKWQVYRLISVDHEEAMNLKAARAESRLNAIQQETARINEEKKKLEPVVQEYQQSVKEYQDMQKAAEALKKVKSAKRTLASDGDAPRGNDKRSKLVCQVKRGMSSADVEDRIGRPDSKYAGWNDVDWNYGSSVIKFENSVVTSFVNYPSSCK